MIIHGCTCPKLIRIPEESQHLIRGPFPFWKRKRLLAERDAFLLKLKKESTCEVCKANVNWIEPCGVDGHTFRLTTWDMSWGSSPHFLKAECYRLAQEKKKVQSRNQARPRLDTLIGLTDNAGNYQIWWSTDTLGWCQNLDLFRMSSHQRLFTFWNKS